MNSAQMSKWPNHLYYIIIMWGRLICIDYFQDFIFRLGIAQWVDIFSWQFLFHIAFLIFFLQCWYKYERLKKSSKNAVAWNKNCSFRIDFKITRPQLCQRLMQMFGFTEVLLSTYYIYFYITPLAKKDFKQQFFSTIY